jgi:hypothetical protein
MPLCNPSDAFFHRLVFVALLGGRHSPQREVGRNQGCGPAHGPPADGHPGEALIAFSLAVAAVVVLDALQQLAVTLLDRLGDLLQQTGTIGMPEVGQT